MKKIWVDRIMICAWVQLLCFGALFPAFGQAPRITVQPEGGLVPPGQAWALSAKVAGAQPLKFQWFRDGQSIEGATGSLLVLTNTNAWFNDKFLGNYYYVARNDLGAVTSSIVEVKDRVIWRKENGGNGHGYSVLKSNSRFSWIHAENLAKQFSAHLATINNFSENIFVFNLIKERAYWRGDSNNNFRGPWLGGFRSSIGKNSQIAWRWVTGEDVGFQNWEIGEPNNGGGIQDRISFYTNSGYPAPTWDDNSSDGDIGAAIIEFPESLLLYKQPKDVVVSNQLYIQFEVAAASMKGVKYQWQRDGVDIDGATNFVLSINRGVEIISGRFCAVVRDGVSTFVSSAVRPLYPPILSAINSTNHTTIEGGSVTLSAPVDGRKPFYFQWFRNSTPIQYATNQYLNLTNLKVDNTAHYWTQVSNQDGFTNSPAVLVKVLPAAYSVVFQDDFEKQGIRPELSWRQIRKGEGLRSFSYLGDFSARTVGVNLTNLQPHSHVHLQVDVLIFRSADGTDVSGKGDVFRIKSKGDEVNYQTSFSNHPWSRSQTYPGRIGEPLLNARAGSIEQNTLEVVNQIGNVGERPQNTLYRIGLDFPHTATDLNLTFSGEGWGLVTEEAWGLDNMIIATANLVEGNPPVLTRGPEPQVVRVGDAGVFQISAASVGAIDYQWFVDGTPIPDATNAWYAIPAVYPGWYLPETPGNYSVKVSNAFGSVTRPPVPLIVVTEHPESITGVLGRDLELKGRSTRPAQYQWMRDGVILPGETNSTLTIRKASSAEAGLYGLIFGLGGSSVSGGGFEVAGPARVDFNQPGQPGEPLWRHRSIPQPVNNIGEYLNPVTALPGGGFIASAFALKYEEFSAAGAYVADQFPSALGYSVRGVVIDDLGRRICLGFTGGSMSTNILQVYSSSNKLLWEARFPGAAINSPAIHADGRIVVGATTYNGAEPTAIYCFSPDGARLWSRPTGRVVGQPSIGVDGIIYFGEESPVAKQSKVYALRPDGSVLWSVVHGPAVYASPTLTAEGEILIADTDGVVTCYRPDATKRWSYKADSGIRFGSPVLDADGNIYFATTLATVYSLRTDGTLRWFVEGSLGISGSLAVSQGGSVYAIDGDGRLVAVGVDGLPRWSSWLPRMNQYWWTGDSPAILSDGTVVAGSLPYMGGGVLQGFRGDGPPAQSAWPLGRQNSGMGGRARIRVKSQPSKVSIGAVLNWIAETSESGAQFQWLRNGAEIPGATSAKFRVGPVQPSDSGQYQVRVVTPRGAILGPVNEVVVDSHFERITSGPQLGDGIYTGVNWGDVDGDGLVDLFLPNPSRSPFLFRNLGGGRFEEWSPQGIISEGHWDTEKGLWADWNGDGIPELTMLDFGREGRVFGLLPGKTNFVRIPSPILEGIEGGWVSAAAADFDLDGKLDLFAAQLTWPFEQPGPNSPTNNVLLRGLGNGSFERITDLDPILTGVGSFGASWCDYDNDGDPDLFVAHHAPAPWGGSRRNFLFRNDGTNGFSKASVGAPVTNQDASNDTPTWGDFDNDGDFDLLVTRSGGSAHQLYRNEAGARFVLQEQWSTPASGYTDASNAAWGDLDNDGWLDAIVTANKGMPALVMRNLGNGTFERKVFGSLGSDSGNSTAVTLVDDDNDGRLDVFVANYGGGNFYYRNWGAAGGWLKVRTRGVISNRQGIGAKIRVTANLNGIERQLLRQISAGDGGGNQGGWEAHFGLADAGQVSRLRIEWPSGQVQERVAVAVRQILTVTESTLALPRQLVVQWGWETTISANGEPPANAKFEWSRDGVAIPGATGPKLTLSQITPAEAGRYQLRAVGISETVLTAPMVLTVDGPEPLASRKLPVSYWPGVPLVVSVRLTPRASVVAQAFEDQPPSGWTISTASDGGQWDAIRGCVKFGPYFDDQARDLSYTLVPGLAFSSVEIFGGTAAADDITTPVIGQHKIPLGPVHPADRNPFDGRIMIGEITSYASAWRRGSPWPSAPQKIPIDFVTRAGYLWRLGEGYWHDLRGATAPMWWKAATDPKPAARSVGPGMASKLSIAERRVPQDWVFPAPLIVTLQVDPVVGAGSVAVEDRVPTGWRVEEPNLGGGVNDTGQWVRWGPFFDSNPRTLQYRLVPTANAELGGLFEGIISVDGLNTSIGGVACIPQPASVPPGIRLRTASASSPSKLEIVGETGSDLKLEMSTDLRSWSTVQHVLGQGADRPVVVELATDPAVPVRFWRVRR
jgi:hypothetical protein